MKLPTKRIIFVGFAFFLICTFWQAYDTIIPKILTDKFGMSQSLSRIIMALDNVLALFMLPLFGAISDRTKHRLGKRTPYILIGTVVAAVFLIVLTFADNAQLHNIAKVAAVDDEEALTELYNHEYRTDLMTPDGETFTLREKFTREEFVSIRTERNGKTDPYYVNYVVPARQAYAREVTEDDPAPLIVFIALLLVILIAMATFRSPAVALMPDVTPKPLRSQANAVINLMGTAGGILVLGMGIVFKTGADKNALMSYTPFFAVVAGVMILALLIFLWQVKEPKLVEKAEEESRALGIDEDGESEEGKRKLSRGERISLLFLLLSVVLWFMGYNAVTSKYSVYAGKVLNLDYNLTLLVANIAAIISYIPVGFVASKIGRKKTILAGVVMLSVSFLVAAFMREGSPALLMNVMFALAGIGWATINVNSFPMVVELAKGGNVGRYTGFYYTASMAAQTVTPYLSGLLMDKMGMTTLFPYAVVFSALAFVSMLPVRHGDSRPPVKKNKLEMLEGDND